jgi:hypothetical protein
MANDVKIQHDAALRVARSQQIILQDTKTFAATVSLLNESHHLNDETILHVTDKGSPQYRHDMYAALTEQVNKNASNPKITESQVQVLAHHRELFSQNEQSHALYRQLLQTDYARQHGVTATLDSESVRNPSPLHLIGLDVAIAESKQKGTLTKPEAKRLANLEKLRNSVDRKLNPRPGLFAKLRAAREAIRPKNIWRGVKKVVKFCVENIRDVRDERRLEKLNKLTGNSQAKARQSSKDFYAFLEAEKKSHMEKNFSSFLEDQIKVQSESGMELKAQKQVGIEKEFDVFLKTQKKHQTERPKQAYQSTLTKATVVRSARPTVTLSKVAEKTHTRGYGR